MKASKKFRLGSVFTSIIIVFMLSSMTLFSSCYATVSTPRHVRANVVIRSQGDDNNGHRERNERRERREHRDRD